MGSALKKMKYVSVLDSAIVISLQCMKPVANCNLLCLRATTQEYFTKLLVELPHFNCIHLIKFLVLTVNVDYSEYKFLS